MKTKKRNLGALKWLLQTMGSARYAVLLVAALEMVMSALAVATAWVIRGMVDGATSHNGEVFWFYVKIYAAVTIAQLLFQSGYRLVYSLYGSALDNRLRARLFSTLLRKDYATVTAQHTGQWLTRLTSDTNLVTNELMSLLPGLLGLLVQFCGALWLVLQMLPGVMYVVLPSGIAMIVISWSLRKTMKKLHKDVQEASGQLTAFLTERLSAMLVVRAFGKEEEVSRQAWEQMGIFRRTGLRRSYFSNFCSLCFSGGIYFVYLLCTIYGGYCILSGTMTYGTFTAMLQLVSQMQSPLASISGYLPRYYTMIASAERLMEAESYLDDCPEGILEDAEITKLYQQLTALGTQDLTFAYPGQEGENPAVLKGLNLTIAKGEYVAFTGHSGCGKSTAMKLLLGLYTPDSGNCYLRTGQAETLSSRHRGLFAYVPQGNQLLSGTIREVVTFGSQKPEEYRLRQALAIACAGEFVDGLEQGLDTLLGERGAGLSEGQMQRIAIARAIYSGRPILLLDEATSSLDEDTERQLLVNLRKLTDKTVLIITHRPAALEICDKIIPFEGGTP